MTNDVQFSGVVDNLVTQFSSALDCFRELVQNSIDAGTSQVEVWTAFEEGEGHLGVIELHVDDYGEGMDEAIIDNQLTKLFSSSKEDDLTKIGKFGIGFVSVFALGPHAVLLHTGRGGEYWEVFFYADRSFTKKRLDVPLEGTQLTIYLEGDYHRYQELVDGIQATLARWCAHSETEITFEDRSPPSDAFPEPVVINEEFRVEGICPVIVEHPGTQIALAYNDQPFYGFYNRGLTLVGTDIGEQVFDDVHTARYRYISLKIKSRYLEHTLSRESIMRDENYHKAIALLDEACEGPLMEGLVAEIERLVALERWSLGDMSRYATVCKYLASEPIQLLTRFVDEPLFRGLHGGVYSADDLYDHLSEDGRILVAEEPTDLTRRLTEGGTPVLLGSVAGGGRWMDEGAEHVSHTPLGAVSVLVGSMLRARKRKTLLGKVKSFLSLGDASEVSLFLADPDEVFLPVELDAKVPGDMVPLVEDARKLLDAIGAGFRSLGTFVPSSSMADVPFFVVNRKLGPLMARPPVGAKRRGKRMEAAVNRSHPHFGRLLRAYGSSPDLATYCLAKGLLLSEDKLLHKDMELMRAALGGSGG